MMWLYFLSRRLAQFAPFIGDPLKFRAFMERSFFLSRDPLTDLMTRREWMDALQEQIASLYPYTQAYMRLGEGVSLEAIAESLPEDLGPPRLWFIAGDIAYLSLANAHEELQHEKGNQYLGSIAKVLRGLERKRIYPGRLGGDEFALLVLGRKRYMEVVRDRVFECVGTQALEVHGKSLPARIDLGVAEFTEALEIFRELVLLHIQEKAAGRDPFLASGATIDHRTLLNIFLRLADWRADLSKKYSRYYLLADLWISDRDWYHRVVDHLRKAVNISDNEVIALAAQKEQLSEEAFSRHVVIRILSRVDQPVGFLSRRIWEQVRGIVDIDSDI